MRDAHSPVPSWMIVLPILVLLAAYTDYGIGQSMSATGELRGLALPPSTVLLAITLLLYCVAWWRRREWPRISWGHALLLTTLIIGLLGMSRAEAPAMLKEIAQLGEIFIAAWLIGQMADEKQRRLLGSAIGVMGILLLAIGSGGPLTAPIWNLGEARYATLLVLTLPFFVAFASHWFGRWGWLANALVLLIAAMRIENGGLLLTLCLAVLVAAWAVQPRHAKTLVPALVLALVLSAIQPAPNAWHTLSPNYDATHPKRLNIEYLAALDAPAVYPLGSGLGHYKEAINVLRQRLPVIPHPEDNKVPRESNNQYLVLLVEAGLPAMLALVAVMLLGVWHAAMYLPRSDADRLTAAGVGGAMIGLALAALFCTVLGRGLGIWSGLLLGLAHHRLQTQLHPLTLRRLALPVTAGILALVVALAINDRRHPIDQTTRLQRAAAFWQSSPAMPLDEGPRVVLVRQELADPPLRLEAEAFNLAEPMQAVPANDTSGNHALDIPEGSGKGNADIVGEVDIPRAGNFRLSARVYWRDGCGNSVGLRVGERLYQLSSGLFGQWHVLTVHETVELPAGPMHIGIVALEDGIMLDYLELTRLGD